MRKLIWKLVCKVFRSEIDSAIKKGIANDMQVYIVDPSKYVIGGSKVGDRFEDGLKLEKFFDQ